MDALNPTPYRLSVSKPGPDSWTASGRRAFLDFRDLGIADGTAGDFGARLARSQGEAATTGWHSHPCTLQILYVLTGWVELAFETGEVVRAEAGTCVQIPGGMVHNEIGFSDDWEILEISSPPEMINVPAADPFPDR